MKASLMSKAPLIEVQPVLAYSSSAITSTFSPIVVVSPPNNNEDFTSLSAACWPRSIINPLAF